MVKITIGLVDARSHSGIDRSEHFPLLANGRRYFLYLLTIQNRQPLLQYAANLCCRTWIQYSLVVARQLMDLEPTAHKRSPCHRTAIEDVIQVPHRLDCMEI